MALAAVCLRCVCVARYRTTSENSRSRGKRKESRGKCKGATKTNDFAAVDAYGFPSIREFNFFDYTRTEVTEIIFSTSRFFFSYFLKKDDWPKAYAGPRLPTLPYILHCLRYLLEFKSQLISSILSPPPFLSFFWALLFFIFFTRYQFRSFHCSS